MEADCNYGGEGERACGKETFEESPERNGASQMDMAGSVQAHV